MHNAQNYGTHSFYILQFQLYKELLGHNGTQN